MNIRMLRALTGVSVILGMLFVLPAWAVVPVGTINKVSGKVTITRNGETFPAQAGQGVLPGDRVRTGVDGRVEWMLATGTIMRLDRKTRFEVKGTAAQFEGFMPRGLVWNQLTPLSSGMKFEVRTPAAVAGARGTVYSVEYRKRLRVRVYRGKVKVEGQKVSKMVKKGRELLLKADGAVERFGRFRKSTTDDPFAKKDTRMGSAESKKKLLEKTNRIVANAKKAWQTVDGQVRGNSVEELLRVAARHHQVARVHTRNLVGLQREVKQLLRKNKKDRMLLRVTADVGRLAKSFSRRENSLAGAEKSIGNVLALRRRIETKILKRYLRNVTEFERRRPLLRDVEKNLQAMRQNITKSLTDKKVALATQYKRYGLDEYPEVLKQGKKTVGLLADLKKSIALLRQQIGPIAKYGVDVKALNQVVRAFTDSVDRENKRSIEIGKMIQRNYLPAFVKLLNKYNYFSITTAIRSRSKPSPR